MRVWFFLSLFFSSLLWCQPSGLEVVNGTCTTSQGGRALSFDVSDGAILHWKDFSIGLGEKVHFLQPSEEAWVLNKVMGSERSHIEGLLSGNGQVVLLNPNGILIGKEGRVEVGGFVASSLGEVLVEGKISAESVALIGNSVGVSGEVLTRVGKYSFVRAEDNPYDIAIHKKNGRVYISSEVETFVKPGGKVVGEEVFLLSEGKSRFEGYANVGSMEISGKEGFFHNGVIDRTGPLLLDPESDITISTALPYNYDGKPTSDFCNIHIDTLIQEIEKGPLTITTFFDGEGGSEGSIHILGDVNHSFNSPYPLVFHTEGSGGILLDGSLTNTGLGTIECVSSRNTIQGKLQGHTLRLQGELHCSGELYGKHLFLEGRGNSSITGKVMTDGGSFLWQGGEELKFSGEWGHLGGGTFEIHDLKNLFIETGGHLYCTNRTEALTFKGMNGVFSVHGGKISAANTPLTVCGKGVFSMEKSYIESLASLTVQMEGHCHLYQSSLHFQKPIHIDISKDFILMEGSTVHSPHGVRVNTKGSLIVLDTSSLTGRGLTLNAGESLFVYEEGVIGGGTGPLFVSAAKGAEIQGMIEGGQVTLHAGDTLSLEGEAKVTSTMGPLSITAGSVIRMDDHASLISHGGNLDLVVTEGSLTLFGESLVESSTHGTHILTSNSLYMENFSKIKNTGQEGTTIIVDHLDEGGGLVMHTNAAISTGSSPLRIFATKRSQSAIDGTLNGHRYSPSLLYLTTEYERWGVTYPDLAFAPPYTFLYKENGLIPLGATAVNQQDFCNILLNFIGPYTAELFRDLHPYNEFTNKSIYFTDEEEPYYIRRRTIQKDPLSTLVFPQ